MRTSYSAAVVPKQQRFELRKRYSRTKGKRGNIREKEEYQGKRGISGRKRKYQGERGISRRKENLCRQGQGQKIYK